MGGRARSGTEGGVVTGGKGDGPVMVANPYLAAIKGAKASAEGPAEDLKEGLKSAKAAMNGNCWQSPMADAFYGVIAQHERTLSNCKTNAMDEFDEAIAKQPEKVEANSWQVHWHNL
jgi:hypothetical protein